MRPRLHPASFWSVKHTGRLNFVLSCCGVFLACETRAVAGAAIPSCAPPRVLSSAAACAAVRSSPCCGHVAWGSAVATCLCGLHPVSLRTPPHPSLFRDDTGYLSVAKAIEFPTAGGLTAHAYFYPPNNRSAPRLGSTLTLPCTRQVKGGLSADPTLHNWSLPRSTLSLTCTREVKEDRPSMERG